MCHFVPLPGGITLPKWHQSSWNLQNCVHLCSNYLMKLKKSYIFVCNLHLYSDDFYCKKVPFLPLPGGITLPKWHQSSWNLLMFVQVWKCYLLILRTYLWLCPTKPCIPHTDNLFYLEKRLCHPKNRFYAIFSCQCAKMKKKMLMHVPKV